MKLFVTKESKYGFAVCVAESKEEAIQKLEAHDYMWNVEWLRDNLEEHPITAVVDRME